MHIIDSHAHLGAIDEDALEALLQRASQASVHTIVNIATNVATLQKGQTLLAHQDPKIYLAAATTPHDVAKEGASFFPLVEEAARQKTLIAIGETGLDYHYEHSPKETQIFYFRKYLALAQEVSLPVIIHCRNAFQDLFAIIQEIGANIPILIHCFTGTKEEAQKALHLGCYLSLSGIVTFAKSKELQEIASFIPMDRFLIETDTPYLAPMPYRGKSNEPSYIIETARMIAALRNISVDEVIEVTSRNTKRFFHVP